MRWLRLLLLGLASVYPLYWTTQFLLFFVPETLAGYWLGYPVRVLDVSYLQVIAVARPHAIFPSYAEALAGAVLVSVLVLIFCGERFLTGGFAIAVLGQAALMPFLGESSAWQASTSTALLGAFSSFALMVLGLHRIVQRLSGCDFTERLALLSLMTVFPQAALWMGLRLAYPSFDGRMLVALLVPMFFAAVIACLLPTTLRTEAFAGADWSEILASSALACLLILGIGMNEYNNSRFDSRAKVPGGDDSINLLP
jgi:hypothetical protein